jgi:K+-sensing histidine kinase KdpD
MPQRDHRAPRSPALRGQGPEYWHGLWRKVVAVKVAAIAVSLVLVVALVPDRHTRDVFIGLVAGIYLPVSVLLYLIQRRHPEPPNVAWFAVTLSDISVVALGQALFPRLSVAFLGLTAIVMVSAVLLGVRWTLVVASACAVGLFVATEFGVPEQPSRFSAVIGSLLMAGMAYLIGSLGEHEREAAERTRRLARAIGSVTSSLELPQVLASLCEAAREAMGSGFAAVLLNEDESLVFGAGSGEPPGFPTATMTLANVLREAPGRLAITGQALRTLEPAVVEDVERHSADIAEMGRKLGTRSGMAIPIIRQGEAVGVLNAYLPRPHSFSLDEIEFMVALAENAGIAIERARLYGNERATAERLRELDRLRSEFVSTVSHELRTPLTAIKGFALTLQNQWREFPDELREELLERLGDNSASLEHLITHLLDFGRLERGEFQVQPEDLPLEQMVQRVLANMVHELSGHRISTDIPANLVVRADRFAFDRILSNLLSNAAKFSPPGTPIEVSGGHSATGDEVVLVVLDHGLGLEPGEEERIFERFYRGKHSARGTGIGLAVARDLAQLHGGRVEAANAPSGGAVFTVYFPIRIGAVDEAPALSGTSGSASS